MKHSAIFVALTTAAVLLIVAGFIVPPTGVIDPSVLTAIGELFGFAALAQIPAMIESGHRVKITHGQTTIEAHDETPTKEKSPENAENDS